MYERVGNSVAYQLLLQFHPSVTVKLINSFYPALKVTAEIFSLIVGECCCVFVTRNWRKAQNGSTRTTLRHSMKHSRRRPLHVACTQQKHPLSSSLQICVSTCVLSLLVAYTQAFSSIYHFSSLSSLILSSTDRWFPLLSYGCKCLPSSVSPLQTRGCWWSIAVPQKWLAA